MERATDDTELTVRLPTAEYYYTPAVAEFLLALQGIDANGAPLAHYDEETRGLLSTVDERAAGVWGAAVESTWDGPRARGWVLWKSLISLDSAPAVHLRILREVLAEHDQAG